MLAALSVGAGMLSAAVALPVVGVAGVAIRDASTTFNNLPVAGLGQVPSKTEILDSSGRVIATYYPRDIFRDPVKWNQIAPVMRNSIVAIEDYRYWQHGAFDLHGTLRAFFSTLSGHQVQGGSDLAQQYVKNACILTARNAADAQKCTAFSPARKITELRIAANVEREMTKPQLLTAYLNVAYFDHQAYGIKVASEYYFSVPPSKLSLTQAALLAGMVESPTQYDPVANPQSAKDRRAQVLLAMARHGYISRATANQAIKAPLGLHLSSVPEQTGCTSTNVKDTAFFCDYVMSVLKNDPAYKKADAEMQGAGGLKIYTTLSAQNQQAATNAVNYVVPAKKPYYNPGYNADAEVLMQPGTGFVRAIAVDRPYGYGRGQTSIDYAVDTTYDGGAGVQTGSSSKLFTLITALKQGYQFGYHLDVHNNMTVGGFTSCSGQYIAPFTVRNADGNEGGAIPLNFGTTASINAFYVDLESHVGLCNVVKTAVSMGVHRADGKSLLKAVGNPSSVSYQPPADTLASFTLGSINVSPMTMAAAYATVAARGVYCRPIAISKITDLSGHNLPIESAACHRVMSKGVADAANYILRGVLTGGTAAGRGIGRPAAAKTGTANNGYYAAFAGYTPTLAGYVSVFNPLNPTTTGAMLGYRADFRQYPGGYLGGSGQMFGDDAPGATWDYTFTHAYLGRALDFVAPPAYYFALGDGSAPPPPPPPPKPKKQPGGGGKGGGGGGGGNGGGGGGNGH
ncbi:MAG TPA: transglycosylase domain-containing protein [Streptosporangiaceae bacterium]|nr:transglycosylase domain-containing protein [Streptosporangiaceae bacterium]